MQRQSNYKYVKLADLERAGPKGKIYTYGVVVEVKTVSSVDTSENSLKATELHLRDESADSFVRCIIYSKPTDNFSKQIAVGQVVQLHRIQIRRKAGMPPLLHGQLNIAGLAVVLFNGQPADDYAVVYHSSANYSLPADYKQKIATLRALYAGCPQSSTSIAANNPTRYVTFENVEEITPNHLNEIKRYHYHNVVAQAISIFVGDLGSVVLRCWDTTTPPRSSFFFEDERITEILCTDKELDTLAGDYRCDIIFYKEHADFVKNSVKPGDVLLLVNLHYYVSLNGNSLIMHEGGMRYKRGIRILSDSSYHKKKLLRDVRTFTAKRCSSDATEDFSADMTQGASGKNAANVTNMSFENAVSLVARNSDEIAVDAGEDDSMSDSMLMEAAIHVVSGHTVAEKEDRLDVHLRSSANLRQWQIHALHLGWIVGYLLQLLNSERNSQSVTLQRSLVLATRGAQYLIRCLFRRLEEEKKESLGALLKMPNEQRNSLLERFLLLYLGSTSEDLFKLHKTRTVTNKLVTEQMGKGHRKRKASSDVIQAADQTGLWELVKCIIPGTVLNLSRWSVSLSHMWTTAPVFALICSKCSLWSTISAGTFAVHRLCPLCFKNRKRNSTLLLQCYIPFSSTYSEVAGEETYYFLFPIELLAFFLVDVPENAVDAIQKWRKGLTTEEKQEISNSIQEKMLSKYSFTFTRLKIRKADSTIAVFEVEKITFADLR